MYELLFVLIFFFGGGCNNILDFNSLYNLRRSNGKTEKAISKGKKCLILLWNFVIKSQINIFTTIWLTCSFVNNRLFVNVSFLHISSFNGWYWSWTGFAFVEFADCFLVTSHQYNFTFVLWKACDNRASTETEMTGVN